MAQGITYDQVAAVADALVAEGRPPSIRVVRERLRGTGSPNTIHKHLTKWRDARPASIATAPELPPTILREIHQEITRAALAARAESEARLALLQSEAADLAATGEALETERDDLQQQVAGLTRERDTLHGQAGEQAKELSRLALEIERERRAAEEARIEIAQGRLSVERQTGQVAEYRTELEQLRTELKQERTGRIEAQRQQSALEVARTALTERFEEAQEREQSAVREIGQLRTRLDTLTEQARTDTGALARLEEEVKAARDALTRSTADVERLRVELTEAREAAQAPSDGHSKK